MSHRSDAHDKVTSSASTEVGEVFYIESSSTTRDVAFAAKKVVEFPSTMTLGTALRSLADNQILSAPVWDETNKRYLGFVDVFDLLTLAVGVDVIAQLIPRVKDGEVAKDVEFDAGLTLKDLFEDNGAQPANAWVPVQEGSKLRDVVRILATKAKRVPVLGPNGRVVQIISQSQITELINKFEAFADLLSKSTLAQTGFGLKPVLTVKATDPARLAFQIMVENNVSSVCVVDEETGQVLTALSTKDIRLLPRIENAALVDANLLSLSCQEFVARIRQLNLTTTMAACAVVDLGSNLHVVLGKLAASRLHRVYVVDAERKPVGVISVSDVVVALQSVQSKQ
ncbi:hypothetical protein BASA81_009069 [Batrachochytrium salamandrivorans]|nr:hypothetical protein BASA81_009069 [Batrachochytrium salamandrivorans]